MRKEAFVATSKGAPTAPSRQATLSAFHQTNATASRRRQPSAAFKYCVYAPCVLAAYTRVRACVPVAGGVAKEEIDCSTAT